MAGYEYTEIDLRPFRCGPSRSALRKRLLLHFANENPGQGKAELTSRYRYLVETLEDGTILSIVRPGRRPGIDFRIEVPGMKFGNRTSTPKYDDILGDLREKKEANEQHYKKLLSLIEDVYRCEDIKPKQIALIQKKFVGIGYPVDLVLWLTKWFFIEQDLHFWNSFGRDCDFYRQIPR